MQEARIHLGAPTALLVILLTCSACPGTTSLVTFPSSAGGKAIRVELATTPAARNQGLMYRKDLTPEQGMLFLFPDDSPRAFWMKNTPLSLDIIFLDAERKIVGIVRNTTPFSTKSLPVATPSRYVLEVRAGVGHSLKEGDRLEFTHVPPSPRT